MFIWVFGEFRQLCAKFGKFLAQIHREMISQSWLFLTPIFNFPIVQWIGFWKSKVQIIAQHLVMFEQNSMCVSHVYHINYCQACHNKKPNTMALSVSSISGNWVFFILVSSNFLSKPDVAYIPLIHQAPEILKRRQRKIKLRPLQTENVPNWVFYKLTIVTKISIINQLRWAG